MPKNLGFLIGMFSSQDFLAIRLLELQQHLLRRQAQRLALHEVTVLQMARFERIVKPWEIPGF